MRYAVKVNGQWYVCVKAKNQDYFLRREQPDKQVWSEVSTTAYICEVGEEERIVELD